ncbi:MAG: energy transducer TonB [Saprospiraceae bacterium]|nr:energy transducer TonB [Saprospiraceae bacterium]
MKRLDKLRPVFFRISLILVLTLVILVFNLTVHSPDLIYTSVLEAAPPALEVIRTQHPDVKKRVPPPAVVTVTRMIDSTEFVETKPKVPEPPSLPGPGLPELPVSAPPAPMPPVPAPSPPPPAPPDDTPLLFADKMPSFGDCRSSDPEEQQQCSDRALLAYIQSKLRYPALARENGIEGMVVVEFVVEKDGSVSQIKLLHDIGMGCGKESVRVVRGMPGWSPGIHHGRPVPVLFRLPVRFRLE